MITLDSVLPGDPSQQDRLACVPPPNDRGSIFSVCGAEPLVLTLLPRIKAKQQSTRVSVKLSEGLRQVKQKRVQVVYGH